MNIVMEHLTTHAQHKITCYNEVNQDCNSVRVSNYIAQQCAISYNIKEHMYITSEHSRTYAHWMTMLNNVTWLAKTFVHHVQQCYDTCTQRRNMKHHVQHVLICSAIREHVWIYEHHVQHMYITFSHCITIWNL